MLKILIQTEDRKIEIVDRTLSNESTWREVLPIFEDLLKAMGYQFTGELVLVDKK